MIAIKPKLARPIATLAAVIALTCCSANPFKEEVAIDLPFAATAHMQRWTNTTTDGRFVLRVSTSKGHVQKTMWEDWGPAQKSSYYVTPAGWLVVLGESESIAVVDAKNDAVPTLISATQVDWNRSSDWHFIGTVDGNEKILFLSPEVYEECIDGSSSIRVRLRASRGKPYCGRN